MKLGILVNTKDHPEDVIGITQAALEKGHEDTIFTMDEGIRLIEDPAFRELVALEGVAMSYCDHNAGTFALNKKGVPGEIVCGSQYNNAVMDHESDKVIVL